MTTGRLEAFSDGVIAIIITIMVLELKVPHGEGFTALVPLVPVFLSYVLSFVIVGIYWTNHHHMLHAVKHVDGAVLWANLHLLFWLSLMPFATAFMGENHFAHETVVVYGIDLMMAGLAYWLLQRSLLRRHPGDSAFARAVGNDLKGTLSMIGNTGGAIIAFFNEWVGLALFVAVAIIWLIPDRRFERALASE